MLIVVPRSMTLEPQTMWLLQLSILLQYLHHDELVLQMVRGVRSVYLSPSLPLSNMLLASLLLHKFCLLVNLLIYPTLCLLQDILTKEIIGHGIKRRSYTTRKTSMWVMLITYRVIGGNEKSGYGINFWGIETLVIWNIYYLIFLLIWRCMT